MGVADEVEEVVFEIYAHPPPLLKDVSTEVTATNVEAAHEYIVATHCDTVAIFEEILATPQVHIALESFVSHVVTYEFIPPCFTLTAIVEALYPGTGIFIFTGLLKYNPVFERPNSIAQFGDSFDERPLVTFTSRAVKVDASKVQVEVDIIVLEGIVTEPLFVTKVTGVRDVIV